MSQNELRGLRMLAQTAGDYALVIGQSPRAFNLTREQALDLAYEYRHLHARGVLMADLAVTR